MNQKVEPYLYGFSISGIDAEIAVVDFQIEESMSQQFKSDINFGCKAQIDLASTIGVPSTFSIYDSSQNLIRHFHGVISSLTLAGSNNNYVMYQVRIVPLTWFLSQRLSSQVFQNKNAKEIIEEKLTMAGIPSDSIEIQLDGEPTIREFCAQYQETDLDFIQRLMQEEGMFYFFKHEEDIHKLIISDHSSIHQALAEPDKLVREQSSMSSDQRSVYELRLKQQSSVTGVSVRDYNFQKPGNMLDGQESLSDDSGLNHYHYPGRYTDGDLADKKAKILLEQEQFGALNVEMMSNCGDLIPGFLMKMKGHDTLKSDEEYLITSVVHEGKQGQALGNLAGSSASFYSNKAIAIPASTPYRAQYPCLRPSIYSAQTAIVVGPEGEDIYTDEFGRVKLQFHWDRQGQLNENSSCWVRVSQAWAGAGWGSFSLPRIGQEVVVQFIDGDPDRPLVTGSLYHATRTPAYALPDNKSKTVFKTNSTPEGGGFNELSFEDKKGEENIYFHAERNLEKRIKNDRLDWVGNDKHSIVKNDSISLIEGDQHQTTMGDSYAQIDGGISLQVGAEYQFKNGADYAHESDGDIHIKAGSNLVLEAGSEITLKVGGNFIKIDSSGITEVGSVIKLNSGGSAGDGKGVSIDEPIEAIEAGVREAAQSPEKPQKPETYSPAAMSLKTAANEGSATVTKCEGA